MLARLQSEGVEPVIMSWALVRDIRALSKAKHALSQGQDQRAVFQANQIWAKRQPIYRAALQRISVEDGYALLADAVKLDQSIKGQPDQIEVGSIWFQINRLCSSLSGFDNKYTRVTNGLDPKGFSNRLQPTL